MRRKPTRKYKVVKMGINPLFWDSEFIATRAQTNEARTAEFH
jgi:hypothetical protein